MKKSVVWLAAALLASVAPAYAAFGCYPKIFTPDGDGLNDRLFFSYDNPEGETYYLKVYDAYGMEVWEERITNTAKESWTADGRFRSYWSGEVRGGYTAPPGIYIVYLRNNSKTLFVDMVAVAR